MRALQQTSHDGPSALRLVTDAPVPSPGPDEVLIRVSAAGVNFRDVLQAHGISPGGPRAPFIAGFEAAGEVVAGPRAGAHVVGVGGGAFAEYMVLPSAAVMAVPPGWSDQQALGLVVNWPTALAALKPLGGVTAGQTVLIHAAAGATGQAAVTLAKHFGATVIATASPGKHDVARDHPEPTDRLRPRRRPESPRRTRSQDDDRQTGPEPAIVVEVADRDLFTAETERYRRELLAHCYRMAGSAHDAEDLVQETYLRAWRSYAGFEGRASIRSWLYRIATNVCLTALEARPLRVLPSGLAGPADAPDQPPRIADGVSWLEPLPDAWISAAADDPAAVVVDRESLRLALIAGLQHLPARQRAILLLREVLSFSADETARILDTTTAAVKSGLQRARARLNELGPDPDALLEPTDPRARALLDAYVAAFERSDASLLEQVLRADATLEATPFRDWQAGRRGCVAMLSTFVLGRPGGWRMIPTTANGQPAAVVYHHGAPDGIVVLTATATGVSRVVKFHDSRLVTAFGYPAELTAGRMRGG